MSDTALLVIDAQESFRQRQNWFETDHARYLERQQALIDGRLKPFAAPLVDNTGRSRLAAGALDDDAIAKMDWLVQGVGGSVPGR